MLIELMIVITMINILVYLDNLIFWFTGQCSNSSDQRAARSIYNSTLACYTETKQTSEIIPYKNNKIFFMLVYLQYLKEI